MKKIMIILISFISFMLLTGCQNRNNNTTSSSESPKKISTTTSSKNPIQQTTPSSSETKSTDVATLATTSRDAPIGTWEQPNQKLTIHPDGHWQLEGSIQLQGALQLAAGNDERWLLKLFGFNTHNGNIGTYILATFNPQKNKMNFGYLGQFTKKTTTELSFEPNLFLPNFKKDTIDYSTNLLGTWTMENKASDFQVQTNYNPDLTFEKYADGKGIPEVGTYRMTPLADQVIRIDQTTSNGVTSTTYKLSSGKLIPAEFDWAAEIRNKVPDTPQ